MAGGAQGDAAENGAIPPIPAGEGPRQISPTDIAQFIRLEQCERYLRLRLHQRNVDPSFMKDYGVVPQSIPPILTRSGAAFEERVEQAVASRSWKINFATDTAHAGQRADDNAQVVHLARELTPGETVVLFQPRLHVTLDGWNIRGDIDLLRLHRTEAGLLEVLIADMKSSTATKVEHRLQVAFYHELLAALFTQHGVAHAPIAMGVLYRGPGAADGDLDDGERARREAQIEAAEAFFATREAYLELMEGGDAFTGAVRDLVTGPDSRANRVAEAPFNALPFHLTYKCDGCMFNEFCMKWVARHDDLSLLPHLTGEDKAALQRAGIATTREMATLKDLRATGDGPSYAGPLVPAPGKGALVRRLAATWPVGPRLDELVLRARRYWRWKGDAIDSLSNIPSKGYGSLPYTDPQHNPNLVRIYIDAQHDYLQDRIYLLGALVVGCEGGTPVPSRRRSIVHLTEGPPDKPEREHALFLRFVEDTLRALVEVAAPDGEGQPNAPIHLIFWNRFEQRLLLEGLGRHLTSILGATPLYDFVTQLAAYDSPVVTFLDREIRELRNYPMVCQSLQAVAAYLGFDWNTPQPYRALFRTRMFDFWGKIDWDPSAPQTGKRSWYTSRSRFNSQIPLEYAYAAWNELPLPPGAHDDFASYRDASPDLLRSFHARRLEALERITGDFKGNQYTQKRSFHLPDLAGFEAKAATLGQALDEFVTVERHVELAAWKTARLAPPERRALSGESLIVRYCEADQEPEVVRRNRENERRRQLKSAWKDEHAGARMTKEEKAQTNWSQDGMRVRLRIDCAQVDCDLDVLLGLSGLRPEERVVVCPRTTVDSRKPAAEQQEFTPTPKQMLYGARGELLGITVQRDEVGRALTASVEVRMIATHGGAWSRGFVFGSMEEPFEEGRLYTLDPDANDWYGYFCAKVVEELCALEEAGEAHRNALYARLRGDPVSVTWPPEAAEGQQRFLAGLDALRARGELHDFEESKREYMRDHGDTPVLLVQGPPGTGKSYSTSFALFARLQGALAAGLTYRALLSCKTHAATDVLLGHVAHAQGQLRAVRERHPDLFDAFIDRRLLDIPLFRLYPREPAPAGIIPLLKKEDRPPGALRTVDALLAHPVCVVGATPGGVYRAIKERWSSDLFGHSLCHCLVLDEASQMNLPEAVMAALPLAPDGQLIVVGDHRQMPPIVKHDWDGEPRRTFQEFRSYESLFATLLALDPPVIRFAESFRLHAAMAEFLRREIYQQDGIPYFSQRRKVLPPVEHADPFVAAILRPEHPIVVVVHDEDQSLFRNSFECDLIAPVLNALADAATYHLDPEHGLGVVVPHRAQRAALQEAVPALTELDPRSGAVAVSAVDTVERFQGNERTAILVSATESEPGYLLLSGEFLLDPRRLTVALSRAKCKMILVASRSVFQLFSADEETFAHAQLWKNLLRQTCTLRLWEGERNGHCVEVWGNGEHAIAASC